MGSVHSSDISLKRLIIFVTAAGVIVAAAVITMKKVFNAPLTIMTSGLAPVSTSVTISHIYSSDLRTQITTFLKQQAQPENFLTPSFNREVKRKFPMIKTIEWTLTPERELRFNVVGQEPRFLVNDELIVTDKRMMASRELFQEYSVGALPSITVDTTWYRKKLAKRVFAFLTTIDHVMFQHFNISYHKPSLIKLIPKKSTIPCFLVADEKSFFDSKKYEALNPIFADMLTNGFLNKKILQAKQPLLAFDLRFEKTIAVKFFDSFKRGTGK